MSGYAICSKSPIGYRYKKLEGQGKTLVPDEPRASIVREVLEGFASGRFSSQIEVKRHLDRFPDFTDKSTGTMRYQRVRELLEQPIYAGYLRGPRWNIPLIKGKHEPLVSYETHERVLKRLNSNWPVAPVRKDTHEDFPLRGIVTCACCGRAMTAAWSTGRNRRYPYYFCQNKVCEQGRKSIRKERIEGEFEALQYSLRPDKAVYTAFHEKLRDLWDTRVLREAEHQQSLNAELAHVERKSAQVMERLMLADSPPLIAAYEEQVRKLHTQKIALQEKLAPTAETPLDFEQTYRTAMEFIENPQRIWVSSRLPGRRIVPKLLFGGRLPYHRIGGYRTDGIAQPFKALAAIQAGEPAGGPGRTRTCNQTVMSRRL